MEEKDQSLAPIFLVVLTFSFMLEASLFYMVYLPAFPDKLQIYWMIGISAVSWIHPLLVFVGVYLVGKKVDLRAKLVPLTVLLIVGAYVGSFTGQIAITLISKPELLPGATFTALTSPSFLQSFFAAFTALAIAYLRH